MSYDYKPCCVPRSVDLVEALKNKSAFTGSMSSHLLFHQLCCNALIDRIISKADGAFKVLSRRIFEALVLALDNVVNYVKASS